MPAEIVSIFDTDDYDSQIQQAARRVAAGEIVVIPTETVYGCAGIISNNKTTAKMKSLRRSDPAQPFTVHISHRDDALKYLGKVPSELATRMMKKLWPGPVGLRFDVPAEVRTTVAKRYNINERDVYDGDGRITLRLPDNTVATDVIAEVPGPVVLTASRAAHRVSELEDVIDHVDMVLDAGQTRYNKLSTLIHVRDKGYEIVRAGVYDERIIERMLKTTILFICSGNTCRSPMAEGLARKIIAKKLNVREDELERRGINVVSAGAYAMAGSRATPQAVEALRDIGVDLTKHRSRNLTPELIHQADVIYTMGRAHMQAVLALAPSAREKTTTLDPRGDIDDPIGADVGVYQQLAGVLEKLIAKRMEEGVIS